MVAAAGGSVQCVRLLLEAKAEPAAARQVRGRFVSLRCLSYVNVLSTREYFNTFAKGAALRERACFLCYFILILFFAWGIMACVLHDTQGRVASELAQANTMAAPIACLFAACLLPTPHSLAFFAHAYARYSHTHPTNEPNQRRPAGR